MRKFLRYLWASPATLVGIVAALPWLFAGARMAAMRGVLEVSGGALGRALLGRRFGFGAITFGHVVIALDAGCLDACREHERVHVRQYERWGVLFFPLYAASSAWAWMRGRDAYRDNVFEQEARELDSRLRGNDISGGNDVGRGNDIGRGNDVTPPRGGG